MEKKHEKHCMTIQNNIKVINWPYKFMVDGLPILCPLKKKQETNGITIGFFVWQFMVHSMICISGQPDRVV